jgi:hypothetical protein
MMRYKDIPAANDHEMTDMYNTRLNVEHISAILCIIKDDCAANSIIAMLGNDNPVFTKLTTDEICNLHTRVI